MKAKHSIFLSFRYTFADASTTELADCNQNRVMFLCSEYPLNNHAKIVKNGDICDIFSHFNLTLALVNSTRKLPDYENKLLADFSKTLKTKRMERITNITKWIREIEANMVKSAYLPYEKAHTLNCMTSRFNCGRGHQKGIFVHYHYCTDLEVAVLVCEPREQYRINKDNGNIYGWKNQIPKDYR